MVSIAAFRQMALALPGTTEAPHFHLVSFRVKKKILATIHAKDNRVMLQLPVVEQSVFCSYDAAVFYPVPGAWGLKGATFVELGKVRKAMLQDALQVAYNGIASKKR
jgi:hypothetical protein